ncbi:MAG: hypothetical protein JEZ06_13635 [Anaerolineaceae bacterium]|nr:hypothetical protein [Anaerolineaceae bacterium]
MENNSQKLVNYIYSIQDFKIVTGIDGAYQHMGATLVDGVLQSGLNYKTVVKPRVDKVLANYPNEKTTSEFSDLCKKEGIKNIITWKDDRKPNLILTLISLLQRENVETCQEFSVWLNDDQNTKKLQTIKGIGPKTIDYFKILVGQESVAVDVHLNRFIQLAGIQLSEYEEIKALISKTSNVLGIKQSILDHSIWKYMSEKKQ